MMVAGTWLCAFGTLIPTWRERWGKFGLDKAIGSCSILRDQFGECFLFLFYTEFYFDLYLFILSFILNPTDN